MSESAIDADIYVVGVGIRGARQITREVEEVLRVVNEVFYVVASQELPSYLRELNPCTTNLHPLTYKEGVGRISAYDAMSAAVIDAAIDHGPTALALYGHPTMFVFPSQQIARAAEFMNLRVRVIPGISALDCILADLLLDPGLLGLQIYEATEVLVRKRPIQPDVPCLLWQVGSLESNLYSEGHSRPERFTRIKKYLLQFYSPNHRIAAVHSSIDIAVPSQVLWFPLSEIEAHHAELHQGLTLYIPPTGVRPVMDEELCQALEAIEHLNKITY